MPSGRSSRLPKYRHYKPKHLAVVRIDGRDIYLGKYDSPESKEKYARLIAERFGRSEGGSVGYRLKGHDLTVNERPFAAAG